MSELSWKCKWDGKSGEGPVQSLNINQRQRLKLKTPLPDQYSTNLHPLTAVLAGKQVIYQVNFHIITVIFFECLLYLGLKKIKFSTSLDHPCSCKSVDLENSYSDNQLIMGKSWFYKQICGFRLPEEMGMSLTQGRWHTSEQTSKGKGRLEMKRQRMWNWDPPCQKRGVRCWTRGISLQRPLLRCGDPATLFTWSHLPSM